MIAQSQSGTGKTAAFVLAMLSRVDTTKDYPQVLCLSPTYELAIQTGEVAAKMSRFCPEIKIKYAVRGEESNVLCVFTYAYVTVEILRVTAVSIAFSKPWIEDHRAYHHRNTGQGVGLGKEIHVLRSKQNIGICAGRG